MRYGTTRAVLWIVVGLWLAGGVSAEDTPPTAYLTNVEMVHLVARGAVATAMDEFPESVEGPVTLRPAAPGEADWLVESEIIAALSRKGVTVYAADGPVVRAARKNRRSSSSAAAAPVLDFPFDVAPVLTDGAGVPFPADACGAGEEGLVEVRLVVNEGGSVANVLMSDEALEPFRSAVESAVEKYRFTPARQDDEPVPGLVTYRFDFTPGEEGCEGMIVDPAEPTEESDEGEETSGTAAPVASSPEIDESSTALVYRITEIEMRYPEVKRRFWFGRKRVDRYARLRVELRLRRGEEILWAETAEHYASDRVPYGALRYLENDQYAFAQPELPSGSSGRLVEPLVVAGVIGGLVLLFYANQTGD